MENLKKAYVAGGCFWGMEDLFRVRPGVKNTEVGYLGGINENPTYRNHPKHAEGLEIPMTQMKHLTRNHWIIFSEFTIQVR